MKNYIFIVIILFISGACRTVPVTSEINNAVVANADTPPQPPAMPVTVLLKDRPAPQIRSLTSIMERRLSTRAGRYIPMQTFNTAQGLALSIINCEYVDKEGNVWFGTQGGGISKYDGASFTNYTTEHGLGSNLVYCMMEDSKGNMWFGTWGNGISRFDGHSFTTFNTSNGLASDYIESVIESRNGQIWMGSDGKGVSSYDIPGDTAKHIKCQVTLTKKDGLGSDVINAILEEPDSTLWFSTWEGGVCRYSPSHAISCFTTKNGLCHNNIHGIAQDSSGRIWFTSWGGGICSYTKPVALHDTANHFRHYDKHTGLIDDQVNCVFYDKHDNLWFGTAKGVSRYCNGQFLNYSGLEGLSHENIYCFTEDRHGRLWMGTQGGGTICYSGAAIATYAPPQGLRSSAVWSICSGNNGELWLGTYDSGIVKFDGQNFTRYTAVQGLSHNQINCTYKDKKGQIWMGTNGGGAICYNGKNFVIYKQAQGLAGDRVFDIAEDSCGQLWFATIGGASCYNGTSFINFATAQGLAHTRVNCITPGKGTDIWLGTRNGLGKATRTPGGYQVTSFSKGLPNKDIMCITIDRQGQLWLCTDGGGLVRYDERSFITYKSANGLSNNGIYRSQFDSKGRLWIATNDGISLLKGFTKKAVPGFNDDLVTLPVSNVFCNDSLSCLYQPVFENLTEKNGYPFADINQNALFIDSNDIVWFATTGRLVRLDYNALSNRERRPTVSIRNIKLNNQPVCWRDLLLHGNIERVATSNITEEVLCFDVPLSDADRELMREKFSGISFKAILKYYYVPVGLQLPYNFNNITFDFCSVGTLNPSFIQYQCQLIGYDNLPFIQTGKTSVSYGNISEGTYTLEVKAREPGSEKWGDTTYYTFTVLPPWYRSWLAYMGYILAAACSVYFVIRRRTAQLQRENAQLEAVVNERTAQIVQKNEALLRGSSEKDRILSVVAHDLRSPLGAVMYHTDMMLMKDSVLPDTKRSVSMIRNSISDSLVLVNELLELSTEEKQNIVKKSTNLNGMLIECQALIQVKAVTKRITVELQLPDEEVVIDIDPGKMKRVVCNLADNAIKFSKEDSKVTISLSANDKSVTIKVADEGIGIPEKFQKGLFEVFTAAKRRGTGGERSFGLGLSIAKQITNAHKGTIWFESEVGKGTIFFIQLPMFI